MSDALSVRFEIITDREDGTEVRTDVTEAVQILYDTVESSMDFGSGFLDTEEVSKMRQVAYLAGWPPMEYSLDTCQECGHVRKDHQRIGTGGCFVGRQSVWTNPLVPGEVARTSFELSCHYDKAVEVVLDPGCPCKEFKLRW